MVEDVKLNVPLLRRRVPNLTVAARAVGLRPATVSNLCTGKIPLGRAEVRTLVALASLAGCSLDELVIRDSGEGMIETGIKVVDLLAPIVRGGTIGFVARPGMGQMVVLAELMHRLKFRGFATVLWLPSEESPDLVDVMEIADNVCSSGSEVYDCVSAHRSERDVLLAADRKMVLSGELLNLQERLQEAGARPITIALVDTRFEAADEETPYGPLDSLLRFDMDLSARKLHPAVDPVSSTSVLQEGVQLEASHLAVQQRARKLLRRYRELRSLVNVWGIERIPEADISSFRRGERLEAFLSQPFYVAEPYTKIPGVWLSLQETLDGVKRILDGEADALTVKELTYIGRLS